MEPGGTSRRGRRHGGMSEQLPSLENIEQLIDGAGQITIGAIEPVHCGAIAAEGRRPLAMLVRRDGETLLQLLKRLDAAIDLAHEQATCVDEVNNGPDDRI